MKIKLYKLITSIVLSSLLLTTMIAPPLHAQTTPEASASGREKVELSLTTLYANMDISADIQVTEAPVDTKAVLLNQWFKPAQVEEQEAELNMHIFLPLIQQGNGVGSPQVESKQSVEASAISRVFAHQLSLPIGVATDLTGNVLVTSDNVLNVKISKYAPTGQLLGELPFGNITSSEAIGHLATDPGTGLVWDLLQDGRVLIFNPHTLQIVGQFDIRTLNINTTAVYEFASGRILDLSGSVLPSLSSYADIALFRRGQIVDVFVTGLSTVGVPFVIRLRLTPTRYFAQAIAASLSVTSGSNGVARGVAVNRNGIVLTTLPRAGNIGNVDRAVAFSADFPERANVLRSTMLFNGTPMTSRGMATDPQGNFYIATGVIGGPAVPNCGINSSAVLLAVTADLRRLVCLGNGGVLGQSSDVAINPQGNRLYATVGNSVIALQ